MDEEQRDETLEKLQKEVSDASNLAFVEQLVQNNEIVFKVDEKEYRVRKPTFDERQELFRERSQLYTKLLTDPSYPLEAELRKLYKARGVDIEKMEEQLRMLEKRKQDLYLSLGKMLKEKASDQDCQVLRDEVQSVIGEQTKISIEKTNLLQYSVETNVLVHVYTYLAYLVSEEKREQTWTRIFASLDEFKRSTGGLTNRLIMLASLMVQHELEL
jgi:uncharacterized protein YbgA (DUF1722 family)